jgi:hypothetical protein
MEAARCSDIQLLDYMIEQGEVFDAELLTDLLAYAGSCDRLEAAQWLRKHGADWPIVLRDTTAIKGDGQQWSDTLIAWARAEGCDAPLTCATDTDTSDDDADNDNDSNNGSDNASDSGSEIRFGDAA